MKVIGFSPRHKTAQAMKDIWDKCVEFDIPVPEKVINYFGKCYPKENDIQVTIKSTEWKGTGMSKGLEVIIDDIPSDVQVIRFINAY